MIFDSKFFNTIILLGAIQGFLIGSLLFFSKKNRQSNRLLATLIFLISLACLNIYFMHQAFFDSGIYQVFIAIVPMVVVMPLGPLIFFYVRSSLDPDFKMTKKQGIYFYPVILDLFQHFVALIYISGLITGVIKKNDQPIGHFIDTYDTYVDIPRWISLAIYLWLSARHLAAFKLRTKHISSVQPGNFKWMKELVIVFCVFQTIWLTHLIPYIIPRYSDALLSWGDWYPLYIPLAVIIYWLGIKGYFISQRNYAAPKKAVMANLSLSPEAIQQAVWSLKKIMEEEKLYLHPRLNLKMLADQTGIGQKIISTIINQHLHKSFNEFVNEYRVREIVRRLLKPESRNLTIVGLAYECGFNSQPTFQRAFKTMLGVTPKEFLLKNSPMTHSKAV